MTQTIKRYFVQAPTYGKGDFKKVAVGDPKNHWAVVQLQPVHKSKKKKAHSIAMRLEIEDGHAPIGYFREWMIELLPNGESVVDIDCAADGTVIAVSDGGHAYRYIAPLYSFRLIDLPFFVKNVTVGSYSEVYFGGLKSGAKHDSVFRYYGEGKYEELGSWLKAVSSGNNGTLCGIFDHVEGTTWHGDICKVLPIKSGIIPILGKGSPYKQVSVGTDRSIYFLDKDNNLGQYIGEGVDYQIDPVVNVYTPPPPGAPPGDGTWKPVDLPEDIYEVTSVNSSNKADLGIVISLKHPDRGNAGGRPCFAVPAAFD